MSAFHSRFRKQDAIISDDANRIAVYPRKAADQCRAIQGFEFVEFRTVDNAGDHFADIERNSELRRDNPVQFRWIVCRLNRVSPHYILKLFDVQIPHGSPYDGKCLTIAFSEVIRHSRHPRMHIGTAKVFSADDFAGCRFDQRWPAEKDRPLPLNNNTFIRHGRDIGASRGTRAHYGRNLRNTLR